MSENVDHKQNFFPKKTIKKRSSNKNCSPTNETDVETLEKLNDAKTNLMKTFTDPSIGMIVDDIINVNDWEVNKAYNKKLDQDVQQNYNEVASKMIKITMLTCSLKWLVIARLEIH